MTRFTQKIPFSARANAVGLLAALGVSLALKAVAATGYLERDLALGIAFGTFTGVTRLLTQQERNPQSSVSELTRSGIVFGVLGGALFVALLTLLPGAA